MATNPFILTKIIATVGPACDSPEAVGRLIDQGARVFRINFSHGSNDDFERMLNNIRQAAADRTIEIGVFGDLSGPKIRISQVIKEGIDVQVGQTVAFIRDDITAGERSDDDGIVRFSTTYAQLVDEVEPGQRLLINDGEVRLLAIEKTNDELHCRVTTGGLVTSKKGLNLPETQLSVDSITEYDWRCVDWAIEHQLDYLALSFVRQAEDLRRLKAYLKERTQPGDRIPVIAKIEKPQAVEDLEAIVDEANSVMVARGDLGVEMDLAMVPIIQKQIINACHDHGKPVIVATQMLQSMIESASPTRAEVSDVANAIFEGADCVMLSGETAVGAYPEQAVNMMARIATSMHQHVGKHADHWGKPPSQDAKFRLGQYRTSALAHGVTTIIHDIRAKYVVTWSQFGGGARYLSMNRPTIPILSFSSNPDALRRMNALFAVQPFHMPQPKDIESFIQLVDSLLLQNEWAAPGDPIVIVAGEPIGTPGVTNMVRVHYVGDVCRLPE